MERKIKKLKGKLERKERKARRRNIVIKEIKIMEGKRSSGGNDEGHRGKS